PPGEVHVVPSLGEEFSTAHPGIKRGEDKRPEVRRCSRENQVFLFKAHYGALWLAFAFEPHPTQGIRQQEALVERPEENASQRLEIAVDRRLADLLFPVARLPVLADEVLRDLADGDLAP